MTTNAGSQTATNAAGFGADLDSLDSDKTMKALSDFLRPEFINRVDEVITFRPLSEENFVSIAKIMLDDLKGVLEGKEIDFEYTENVARVVAKKSFSRKFGARNMRRYIERNIEDKLADKIISSYENAVHSVSVDALQDGEEPIIICK